MSDFRYFTGGGGEWAVESPWIGAVLPKVEKEHGPQKEIDRDEYRRLRRNRLARIRYAERRDSPDEAAP